MSFRLHIHQLRAIAIAVAALLVIAVFPRSLTAQPRVQAESLLYDLKHPEASRRQTAVRELGTMKYAPAIPELIALAGDPDAGVRREVEQALEQIEDIRGLPGLVQLTGDTEKDIRERSVRALVNLHLPRTNGASSALAKLGSLINPWSEEANDTVVEADVPVDPSVVLALRSRMSDPDVRVRRSAAQGLGILAAGAALPELVDAVREDRDDQVRVEAIRALRKIGDPSAAAHILPSLNVNNDRIRQEIIGTLGKLRSRDAVPELTKVFEQSKPTDRSRFLALSALADIADPSSRPLFERLTADKSAEIRLYADEGLARLADRSMLSRVSGDRLAEKDARVRTAQAFALLRMGQTEYLDELVRGVGRLDTRPLAKEYLLETSPAERVLLFAKRDKSPMVRAELAEVFGLMGDPAAMPALQDLSRDPDSAVAQAAERALRRLAASPGRHGDVRTPAKPNPPATP